MTALRVSADFYATGRTGKIGGYRSLDIQSDEDIDEFVEDLREELKEELELLNDDEGI